MKRSQRGTVSASGGFVEDILFFAISILQGSYFLPGLLA